MRAGVYVELMKQLASTCSVWVRGAWVCARTCRTRACARQGKVRCGVCMCVCAHACAYVCAYAGAGGGGGHRRPTRWQRRGPFPHARARARGRVHGTDFVAQPDGEGHRAVPQRDELVQAEVGARHRPGQRLPEVCGAVPDLLEVGKGPALAAERGRALDPRARLPRHVVVLDLEDKVVVPPRPAQRQSVFGAPIECKVGARGVGHVRPLNARGVGHVHMCAPSWFI